jgi:hypothetical protein
LRKIASVKRTSCNENKGKRSVRIVMTAAFTWEPASYHVMRRGGSRRSTSFEALTPLARRRGVWPIATGPCPRFVAMASAGRLARPIFYPVGSKSTQLPSLADFITRRDRISRSHASTNISVQTSRYFVIPTPDIRSLGVAQPLLTTSIAVVPQTQRFRRGLPQTNDVQKGIFYVLGPSPRIRVAGFKVRGSA